MVTMTLTRPSVLLTAACTPSAPKPAAALLATPVLAAAWAPVSRVHQVQTQAELALGAGRSNEINGTTGFMGLGGFIGKRYSDERGIPPRGRPV